jgi:LAO/AO transport system kinase
MPLKCFSFAAKGDRRMVARSISRIEAGGEDVLEAIMGLNPRRKAGPGRPHVVGITGPPGAGKSTFVNQLVRRARAADQSVAVVAVDPSSPFSGGAILADRIRMEEHALDTGVFVRSLSSRGHLGGLSRAAGQVVDLLDAAGWDLILVETVGVGQSELAVCEVADTVVVILTPESGDTVQTMKAGLLEIADIFVVNKADRSGAQLLCRELEDAVQMDANRAYDAPVFAASALQDQGVEAVLEGIQAHHAWCQGPGLSDWLARRARGRVRTFLDLVGESARREALNAVTEKEMPVLVALEAGEVSPYTAAHQWNERCANS